MKSYHSHIMTNKTNTGQMESKLVSDLFDISEMAHHAPENLIYISYENYRFVCIYICYSVGACTYTSCNNCGNGIFLC